MVEEVQKPAKRNKPTYFNSIISIFLVLLVLGVLLTIILQGQRLTRYVKESFLVELEIGDDVRESDIIRFVNELKGEPYTKHARYVSKDEALKDLKKKIGEEYVDILDYNPLYAAVRINLNAGWVHPDSVELLKESFLANDMVDKVDYEESLLKNVSTKSDVLMYVLIGFGALLFIIAITLIDSTIRLAMFSDRFVIRSMQLVGATRWFIIKPFVLRGVYNGFISGLLACIAIVGLFYLIEMRVSELSILDDFITFAIVMGVVLATGIFISWLSTHRAVLKYLRMKLDDLY